MSREPADTDSHSVCVPRMTVATAIDLLGDLEKEVKQANAIGPYSKEIESTVKRLRDSLEEK